jgi:tetratricopeptide (TPR) repeat protein
LAQDFELEQPAVTRQFHGDCEKTLAVAEALYVKSTDPSTKARACFYEGGAWGLKGRWEVTRGNWMDAYHAGKEGRSYLKKAISLDPHLYDAYLGLGIYDYYAATLKGVQALLSSLLMHGDRKRGLAETRMALQKGKHARVEAMLFLIDMYTSWEKQPQEALPLARTLHETYPQSPAMHLVLISALSANHQWDAAGHEATIFLQRAEQEKPFYNKHFIPAGLYYVGMSALYKGDSQTCTDRMNTLIASPGLSPNSRWLTFAYLRKGQAYDLEDKRELAVKEYKRVLARPDVWQSQEEAASGLKNPFKEENH